MLNSTIIVCISVSVPLCPICQMWESEKTIPNSALALRITRNSALKSAPYSRSKNVISALSLRLDLKRHYSITCQTRFRLVIPHQGSLESGTQKALERAAGFRLRAIGTTTRLSSGPDICTFRDHVSEDPYEMRALSENRIIG